MNQRTLEVLWFTTQSNQYVAGWSTAPNVIDLTAGAGVTTSTWTYANVGRREMKFFLWPGVTSQAALCTSGIAILRSGTTGTAASTLIAGTTVTWSNVTAGVPAPIHFFTNDRYVALHFCVGANTTNTIVAGVMVEQRAS